MLNNYLNKFSDFSFDHVGIATNSIEKSLKLYSAIGFDDVHLEDVPTEQVRVAMIQLSNGSKIELLEPLSDESPIKKFLLKRGEGIHHICLKTDQLLESVEKLKSQGFQLINDVPRPGAHDCQVIFIHPKSTGGVLLELSQPHV